MIDIFECVQQYFFKFFVQQGIDGLGICLWVVDVGILVVNCELEFCECVDFIGNEWMIECVGFYFYVEGDSVCWLDNVSIDYEFNVMGGQFNIWVFGIKGQQLGVDVGLIEWVQYVLEVEINFWLVLYGGCVSLCEIDVDGVVMLQFGGGCYGCGMVDVMFKQGVEKILCECVLEVLVVCDVIDYVSGVKLYYEGKQGWLVIG